jgi:hypothetical protein
MKKFLVLFSVVVKTELSSKVKTWIDVSEQGVVENILT